MATVMARKAVTAVSRGSPGDGKPVQLPLTLADLITTVQDVVGPEDDRLVVATVQYLLRSGRLTRRGTGTYPCPPQRLEKVLSHIVKGGVRYPSVVARWWLCCGSPNCSRERGATGNIADRSLERR